MKWKALGFNLVKMHMAVFLDPGAQHIAEINQIVHFASA